MPSFKIIGLWVLEKMFKGFDNIWAWCNLGKVTNFTKCMFPLPKRRLHIKFGFDWPSVSEKKMFENNGHIHVYSPGTRADSPLGSFFPQIYIFSVNLVICCKFFPI